MKMFFAADIGNTNIVLGLFEGNEIIEHWRVSTDLRRTEDEYAILLHELFAMKQRDVAYVKGAILESVVPHLNEKIKKSMERTFGFPPLVMTSETPIGLENRYAIPREVGMDRLANAVGGKMKMGAPLIIIDFGTAITLDLVDKDGAYAGGCILPGLETSADALFLRTAQLPRIELLRPPAVLGKTTVASMQSGLYFGTIGAVDTLIDRLWEEIGYKTAIIVTGGGAAQIVNELAHPCEYDPHLTLRGLKAIWEMNNTSLRRQSYGASATDRSAGG